ASASTMLSRDGTFKNLEDILKFPIESSHAYSYAHLSPNSLALRLNVLRRSLEILKDRPGLIKSINLLNDDSDRQNQDEPQNRRHSVPPPSNPLYKHGNNSSEYFNENNKKYKLQSNASSAALAALFRPQMKRSDSFPVNQMYGKDDLNTRPRNVNERVISTTQPLSRKTSAPNTFTSSPHDAILNDDLKEIITILENDKESLSKHSEIASNLHDLSLSTNHTDSDIQLKQDILKNKLLYALATPFIENSIMTSSLLQNNGNNTPTRTGPGSHHPSSVALSALNNNPSGPNSNNRPFHSISSGKHAQPQSVFTVEIDNPWSVKAANDLACLMFGVSKNMIKALTLMDLIAPQFRNFVTERLTNYISRNLDLSIRLKRKSPNTQVTNNNILFAGEIVAILRPGDQNYAWTSMWAKRKGDMIICMFDQIPCDAFDIVILSKKMESSSMSLLSDLDYSVDSFTEIAGDLISLIDTSNMSQLSDISESLFREAEQEDANDGEDVLDYYISQDVSDCEKINRKRYYTLQFKDDENIPCAITSNPLEINQDRFEIKLKIHTLPYIAGIFVVDANNFKILSCNNAIAKNLFGRSSEELNEKSIETLIPNFVNILKCGLEHNSISFELTPGLVLPEHFFRRYDAYLRHQEDTSTDIEELFFKSHGVPGLHRDGKKIYVDIQTRASANDTLVIWITYSRLARKKQTIVKEKKEVVEEIKKPPAIKEVSENHRRTPTGNAKGISSWPSQLNLFSRNKQESIHFAPSSEEISRQNSTRKARNDSFGIPVSRLSYSVEKPHALTKLYDSKTEKGEDESKERSHALSSSTINDPNDEEMSPSVTLEGSATLDDSTPNKDSNINPFYKKFTEEEIIKLEDELLEEKKSNSTHWPSAVGLKRRTKKFTEFKVIKDMGEGAYGKVVLAEHNDDPVYKIIIKCIDKERILVDTWVRDRNLGTIPSEIQVMAFLNDKPHPNIMKIIDFFEDLKYYYLETPIFGDPPGIDLFDYIEVKKDMSELECQFIFKQIVSAIYHLHNNGIVHRDIKDENVIVDENGLIKLIDFGSAGYTKQGPFDVFVGTIDYASPEVLRGEKYEGKPQDVWALGILLYTMLYKENPFYNVDEIMEGDLRIPYIVSEGSMALVKKILVRDIDQRPSITDIVEDEWLRI
ncbi:Pkinase-domain-containing protein, partial [Suhomyces tanzawaensis NRRL Y-17324]